MKYSKYIILVFFSLMLSCKEQSNLKHQINVSIVPKPVTFKLLEKSFLIDENTEISIQNQNQKIAATFLSDLLKKAAGFELDIISSKDAQVIFLKDDNLKREAYGLEVSPEQIIIKANSAAGYFYAVQSLRQLLPPEIEKSDSQIKTWNVPCVSIEDYPRFSWRGMHMDFSRHFFGVDEVKTFLDYMALYKLNTYHMHLTDDQGWRIEIEKYPLLTEKGAWRTENSHDKTCNELSQKDPLYKINEEHYHERDGKKMYGGFFTQSQIKEIVSYAAERHIEVIPEIDMPGHFKAAIDNYPYLSCTGKAGWGETFSIPACLGKETTYDFIKDILSEVVELFPSKYVHIGGDEVNTKPWKTCPFCQKIIKENNLKNEHELQSHFNKYIEKFLTSKGKRLIGWDEIVEGGLSEDATMMWWRNWAPKARYIAANNGNNMVITPDFEYYFDFSNEATPLSKVYNYEPIPEDFTTEQSKHVLGVQANLWSEYIPNFKRLQNQAFPRLLALAETGWSPKASKDFKNFEERMNLQYQRLDALGIYYYISSVVGLKDEIGFIDKATVELKVPLNDMEIYYTIDGSVPSKISKKYTKPLEFTETTNLKTVAYRGDKASQIKSSLIQKLTFNNAIEVNPEIGKINRWAATKQFKVVDDVTLPANAKFEITDQIDLSDFSNNPENLSLVFNGYFKAEEDGLYEFETKSDDGSLLYIGGNLVVNNGGNHSSRLKNGVVALKKGWHALTVKFHEAGGGEELAVWYKAPNHDRKPLNGNVIGK